MRILIILGLIYGLSAYLQYLWVRLAHSKGGIFPHSKPTTTDVALTFIPVVNTIMTIFAWLAWYPIKKEGSDFSNFFGVKKKDEE